MTVDLAVLLEAQRLDTKLDQLRHRRDTLPARAQIDEVTRQLAQVERDVAPVAARREDLARSQKRAEDEVATLEAKVVEEDQRLYGGTVTSPRELQALQDEIAALKRRQGDIETEILEIMDLSEPVDEQLAQLAERRVALEADLERLQAELAAAAADIDAEVAEVSAERAAAVSGLDADVLAAYEKLRGQLGGTAVARLANSICGACHLSISAAEAERLRRTPAGSVPTCPECGAMLVL